MTRSFASLLVLVVVVFVGVTTVGCDTMKAWDGNCADVYNNVPGYELVAQSSDSFSGKSEHIAPGKKHRFTASGYDISIVLSIFDADGYQLFSQVVSVPTYDGFSGCSVINVGTYYDEWSGTERVDIQAAWKKGIDANTAPDVLKKIAEAGFYAEMSKEK